MAEAWDFLSQLWQGIRFVTDKIRDFLFWIAGLLANLLKVKQEYAFIFIILILSLWIASKIFYTKNVTVQGRWGEFIIITAIIFAILKFL